MLGLQVCSAIAGLFFFMWGPQTGYLHILQGSKNTTEGQKECESGLGMTSYCTFDSQQLWSLLWIRPLLKIGNTSAEGRQVATTESDTLPTNLLRMPNPKAHRRQEKAEFKVNLIYKARTYLKNRVEHITQVIKCSPSMSRTLSLITHTPRIVARTYSPVLGDRGRKIRNLRPYSTMFIYVQDQPGTHETMPQNKWLIK